MAPFVVLSLLALAPAVEAPVTAVTVYSDRARVTRTANLKLSGSQRVELPLLGDAVDPSSIWVDARGAEVRRVDIARVEAEDFPRDLARDLLGKLDAIDDQLAKARGEREAAAPILNALSAIAPTVPSGDPLRAPPKLNPNGWTAALRFVATVVDKLSQRQRAIDQKIAALERDRARLADEAQKVGGARRHPGWRVAAVVDGSGPARLQLSYLVGQARWYPSYDIQLQPDRGVVQVAFAGRVSQETGEDWEGAQLTLSTAIPATAVTLPKLATWKIGQRDRFIPTPVARLEPPRPPPPSAPSPEQSLDDERLQARLLAVANGRPQVPVTVETRAAPAQPVYEAPPPPPMPAAAPSVDIAEKPEVTAAAPAMSFQTEEISLQAGVRRDVAQPAPIRGVGLAPPPGYVRPVYSPDLPVSLAGGWDIAFPSLRRETVESGKGARRVALFSESWPVSVERKLFPALAPESYLVAEIKNPSKRALPGGEAHLFVGADPAGTAQLKLVAPGQAFTLPLGIDRALKAVRNVKLVESEKGFFSKDDVGQYVVTTEVANPYRQPVALRIVDQFPIASSKDLEVKVTEVSPQATRDDAKGTLEWRVTVAPGAKQTVRFVYTLRRPKGWRLHQ